MDSTAGDDRLVLLRRPLPDAPDDDLREISRAGTTAMQNAVTLRRYSLALDPAASFLATEELCDLREATLPQTNWRRHTRVRPRWTTWCAEAGERLERWFTGAFDRAKSQRFQQTRLAAWWSMLRIVLSLVIGYLAATGVFAVAAALMALRLSLSLASGTSWSFPSDERDLHATDRKRVFACMAGHVSDSVVLAGIMWCLFANERMIWGSAVVAALVTQLLATLMRVALLQVGIHLPRLRLERVLRAGGVLVALVVAALWQSSVPTNAVPLLGLFSAAPAFVFAAIEGCRTYSRAVYGEDKPLTWGRQVVWPPVPMETPGSLRSVATGGGCGCSSDDRLLASSD